MNTRLLHDSPNIPNDAPSIAQTNEGVDMCIPEQAIQSHDTANNPTIKDLSNNSTKAQRARLLAYLRLHGSITTAHAREVLNIYDQRVRKHELVREGHRIEMTWVIAVTAQGYPHKVGLYTLIEDNDVEVQ
jgi:hypothetical protein